MIERKVMKDKFTEYSIDRFIRQTLTDVPIKETKFEKNPLGERVTIFTSAPGLVIGREGSNIKALTVKLKEKFDFENPQIKIGEIKDTHLSAAIVAKLIANDLARFGSQKFKLTGFKALTGIMNAGAMGTEIKISGKLPSSRAKSWRFSKGYLKKTGYVSDFVIDKAQEQVTLKTGVVGIQVQIMLPDTKLPDKIEYYDVEELLKQQKEAKLDEKVEESSEDSLEEVPEEKIEEVLEDVTKGKKSESKTEPGSSKKVKKKEEVTIEE